MPPRQRLPSGLDRRSFLRGLLGTAGAVALPSCTRRAEPDDLTATTPPPPTTVLPPPTGELVPRERPTLRLSSDDAGLPSPVAYLPTAYLPMTFIYDTLLWPEADGSVTPWLATAYERSPDGLTYTFRLRNGVRWHDGRPLTAEDVAFSFEYSLTNPLIPPWVIFKPRYVAGAEVTGPGTVEVRLERPAVSFPSLVAARFPIIPRHVWSSVPNPLAGVQLSALVGTGPYRLERYDRPTYLFTANDEFFLGRPFVKRIEMSPQGDDLAALRAGTIDAGGFAARPTSGRVVARFRTDPSFGVIEGSPGFLAALHWNLGKRGAVGDAGFRRACAHAIDRHDMVRRLLAGLGHPGNPGLLAPGHPYRVDVEQYAHDPGLANRLLDEAGYPRPGGKGRRKGPGDKPLKVVLTTPAELASAAEVVIDNLAAVGVEVVIDPLVDVFTLGEYEMALLFWGGAGGNTDPDFLRNVYSSRTPRDMFFAARGYQNVEFDDLADRQLTTGDQDQRKQLVARMQEVVAADLPLLPLYYPTPFIVYPRSVFDDAWVKGGDPVNKRALVTGVGGAGTEIRPTAP